MQAAQNEEVQVAREVLKTFSMYGFQKTSMEDIANASGVSRQSIYKRFGSKQKCYEWVIHNYLADMYSRIFTALENHELPAAQTLINVFDILIGEAVEIIRNTHGTEILDEVLRTTHASQEDWPLRLRSRLAEFLARNNYATSSNADGIAFALISVGKGLLVEEPTREKFITDMTLIIDSVRSQQN